MRIVIAIVSFIAAFLIWSVAISALAAWLAFCFGTVIVGVLLLIFAPYILLMPLAIGVPGTALFFYGMDRLVNKNKESMFNK